MVRNTIQLKAKFRIPSTDEFTESSLDKSEIAQPPTKRTRRKDPKIKQSLGDFNSDNNSSALRDLQEPKLGEEAILQIKIYNTIELVDLVF